MISAQEVEDLLDDAKEYLQNNCVDMEKERENSLSAELKDKIYKASSVLECPPDNPFGKAISAMMLYFNLERQSESLEYYKSSDDDNKRLYKLAWKLAAFSKVDEGQIEDAMEFMRIVEKLDE